MSTWEPIGDRPRQNVMPGSRDMDIFEQQEMRKNRPQVTSKLNDWHDWLVNHVPKTIKDKASRAFKTFKDKVLELYDRVKGENTGNELNERETRIEDQTQPYQLKPKGGKETFIEPAVEQPTSNQKQIKRMKKKLGKLNNFTLQAKKLYIPRKRITT